MQSSRYSFLIVAQLALFRKYRSQTFEDLIGQEHVVRTLQSAITSGRISQTYLFTGPRGTGKTSSARLLAKALNCEKGLTGVPCNECDTCLGITAGNHPDVIEMDAASDSGVDDIREKIVDVASYAPMLARYKVFIIDEVHDLSNKAFDALLKTVEEPPPHLIFILATTEFNKVPATIRSRCQKYEFHRATLKNLTDRLVYVCQSEGVTAEPAAISAIARMADGGYRDALTLLEQAILVSDGNITLDVVYDQLGLVSETAIDDLLLGIKGSDIAQIISILEQVVRSGRDPRALLESMLHRLADLTRAIYDVPTEGSDVTRESAMHEFATRLGRDFLISVRSALAEAHKVIRDISLPRLWLESELIRISTTRTAPSATTAVVSTTVVPAAVAKEQPQKSVAVESSQPEATPILGNDWEKVINLMQNAEAASGKSSPHRMRLIQARLIEDTPDMMRIAFSNQMHADWFAENPKRKGYVEGFLAQINRPNTKLEFEVEKKNEPDHMITETVELPVEGARLERMVREVFQVVDARDDDESK
jgi:DNA polymerase III subunit gamma/tau